MKTFTQFKTELFKDPEFKKAYDALEPEYTLIKKLIENRINKGALAKKMGTKQSAISRFEAGGSNPTVAFLYKLADALGVQLKITISE
jgi:ribosome-binding protein aMBF1 (putative translation factor)